MAAFATTTDLANYTGRTVDSDRAALLLDLASAEIRRIAGPIVETTETITIGGSYERKLVLPRRPVTAVTAVAVDGVTLDADTYWHTRDGVLWRSGHWGGDEVDVEVTYTFGLAAAPDWVKGLCLDVCVRALDNPGGHIASEQVDGYAATYTATAAGVHLTAAEERKLARRFGRTTGTL